MAVAMKLLQVLSILTIICNVFSAGKIFYITPSSNDLCTSKPCFTLSKFSTASKNSDTTLILQSGTHVLESNLTISNVIKFRMSSGSSSNDVTIRCKRFTKFVFQEANFIDLSGIKFVGCVETTVKSVDLFTLTDVSFTAKDVIGTAIKITNSNAKFIESKFSSNQGSEVHSITCTGDSISGYDLKEPDLSSIKVTAGGAIVALRSKISIIQSTFEENRAHTGGAIFIRDQSHVSIIDSIFTGNGAVVPLSTDKTVCLAGGGAINVEQNSSVMLKGCSFVRNTANCLGGAINVLHTFNAAIKIHSCNFTDNQALFGGGLNIFGADKTTVKITSSEFNANSAHSSGGVVSLLSIMKVWPIYGIRFTIATSKFINNRAKNFGGVLTMSYIESSDVKIEGSDFISNSVGQGGGVLAAEHNKRINIAISDSSFVSNEAKKGGTMAFNANYRYNRVDTSWNLFQHNTAIEEGGVLYSNDTYTSIFIAVNGDVLKGNLAQTGGAMCIYRSDLLIVNTTLTNNSATGNGGVIKSTDSHVRIFILNTLEANRAGGNGGTIHADGGVVVIAGSSLTNNSGADGGILYAKQAAITIIRVTLNHNKAMKAGGIMYIQGERVSITDTLICNNTANTEGGVIQSYQSEITISESKFFNNGAKCRGGVFNVDHGTVTIDHASFANSSADRGGVMWADHTKVTAYAVNITDNRANFSMVYHMESVANWTRAVFMNNTGSLCVIESTLNLMDVVMARMHPSLTLQRDKYSKQLEEGGAITAFQGAINFYGCSELRDNEAENGGAIHATEVKVQVHGNVTLVNNTATGNGGGAFLARSELTCQRNSTLKLSGNKANKKGGGIDATGSPIKINGTLVEKSYASLTFMDNKAEIGGGLHLQMDAKLYILKSKAYTEEYKIVVFDKNAAQHGGAVYVSDDDKCNFFSNKECFFQSLALYNSLPTDSVHHSIHFSNNTAVHAGNSLYGGLLDICTINPLAEADVSHVHGDDDSTNVTVVTKGLEYLKMISNVHDSNINSPPIRVCFCRDGQPDCSYQPDPISIRRGLLTKVSLSLAVLDQINRPMEKAAIFNRLQSGVDLCHHQKQTTDGNCSILSFAAYSNNDSEELVLFTDGPCKDNKDCQCHVELNVFCPQCPIGFELTEDEEGCRCDCDSKLRPYISDCFEDSQSLLRKDNCWITNIDNGTNSSISQYLIYPHCPLDYCQPPGATVEINLNIPNGSDAQCSDGRSGLLCGTCLPGLSLSLGSSRCIPCPALWYVNLAVILASSVVAGIVLVALLLVLKLTVATGTLNGIIFYANIVAANSNTFLPFPNSNFATVFISWLNLEIGIDVCFFDGLNSFWKTLLQLVFPAYIILLVILIIFISECSTKFAKWIGKRNPVATLATLVLLSYAKLLHTIIASLSFARLNYPDGSREMVWLPNATVSYLRGKHLILFIVAILILIVGLVYTVLLFSWQWLQRFRAKKILKFKHIRYEKLHHFMETYHAPYTSRHRYWSGMLLLLRVLLYIISAVNILGSPRVTLVAIIFVVSALLLVKGTFAKNLYKNMLVDVVETIMYFNLVIFATLTLYSLDMTTNQTAVAYTSVSITLLLFVLTVMAHVYKYTAVHSLFSKSKYFRAMDAKFSKCIIYEEGENVNDTCTVEENHTLDRNSVRPQLLRKPTQTVVEIHTSIHAE